MPLEQIGNLWSQSSQAPHGVWGVLLWNLPLMIGMLLFLLFLAMYLREHFTDKKIEIRKLLFASCVLSAIAIVVSAGGLSILQYKIFQNTIPYALPPNAPLTDYYLGYAFFNFWAQWIVGVIVTAALCGYWWYIKQQSRGARINTNEILLFAIFGILSAWPGIIVYLVSILLFYGLELVILNVAHFSNAPQGSAGEVRFPITAFLLFAAPVSLLASSVIFKSLSLTFLYFVPRVIQ